MELGKWIKAHGDKAVTGVLTGLTLLNIEPQLLGHWITDQWTRGLIAALACGAFAFAVFKPSGDGNVVLPPPQPAARKGLAVVGAVVVLMSRPMGVVQNTSDSSSPLSREGFPELIRPALSGDPLRSGVS